jgi:undecaprenyl-diphosphatase
VTHLWAVILGLVQGITEFLPVSSSAHLTLIPWVFGIQNNPALSFMSTVQFDVALHAGSALAIIIVLWSDWVTLAKGAVQRKPAELRLVGFLLVTSIPGALFGVLLESKVQTVFRAPWLIGSTLIVFGIFLWAVDRFTPTQQGMERMSWGRAAWIGLAQAAAIVPGVSRSGATITAGRGLGLSREAIARYSFMAALPIILGGAGFELRTVPLGQLFSLDWVLGFVAAAISSWLLMRWMLSYVRDHSFSVFMWYRIAIGVFVIALFLVRG